MIQRTSNFHIFLYMADNDVNLTAC